MKATTSTNTPTEPAVTFLSSLQLEQRREQVERELEAAERRQDRSAYACSLDPADPDKRASYEAAERDVSRLRSQIAALIGAKTHAQKQETVAGLEQQLADVERLRRDSLATVDAAGPAFAAVFEAVQALGTAWRALQAADTAAFEAEAECFTKRGALTYPVASLNPHPLVQPLLAFELRGQEWNLHASAFQYGDKPFNPSTLHADRKRQQDRARDSINRYCDRRADALRVEIEAKRAMLAA